MDPFESAWNNVTAAQEDPFESVWAKVTAPTTTPSATDTLKNEFLGVENRLVEGYGILGDTADAINRNFNPIYPGGPRVLGLNPTSLNDSPAKKPSDYLKEGLAAIGGYGDEQAITGPGMIAEEVARYAPGALLGEGMLLPSLVGGAGAGVAKASGFNETGQAIAGLFSSLAPGAASTIWGRGANLLRDLFSPAAKVEQAQLGAKELLSNTINTDDALAALSAAEKADQAAPFITRQSESYLPQYRRTAEIIDQPGAAALENVISRTDDTAKSAITLQDEARDLARTNIFNKLDKTNLSESEAGNLIRQGLETNKQSFNDAVNEFAGKAFKGGEELPAKAAKGIVTATLNQFTKSGARDVTGDFRRLIDNFRALPSKVDLQTLQDFRSAFGEYAKLGLNPTAIDRQTATIAGRMRSTLDNTIEKIALEGNLPKSQYNAWQKMIATRRTKGALYESGATGKALQRDPFNTGYKMAAEKVGPTVIATKEDATQLMAALKGQGKSIEAVRSSLLSSIWNKSTNAMTGKFNPTSFHRQLAKVSEVAPEVLQPSQLKALKLIADDMAGQSRVSELAFKASKGNSITSQSDSAIELIQNAVKEAGTSTARKVINKIPLVGPVIDSMVSIISNPAERQALINAELAKFVTKPEYAKALLMKPSKETIPIVKEFASQLSRSLGASVSSSQGNQNVQKKDDSYLDDLFSGKKRPRMNEDIKSIEAEIDSNPTDAAIYEMESGRNPKAKNPESSAAGAFQLINSTQKALGVKDPFDLRQNYEGYKRLRDENIARFGDDPLMVYSAHYLGAPLLDKVLKKRKLDDNERKIVEEFKARILPRFQKIYDRIIAREA